MISPRQRSSLRRRLATAAAAAAICSCTVITTAAAAASPPKLPVCLDDSSWHCGSVVVPRDRAHPAGAKIHVAYYVMRHTGGRPVTEPIFITPGGPGESGWAERFFYERAPQLAVGHDLVLIDPRGTGQSGAINCPDLQDGWSSTSALQKAAGSCGRHLGAAADRYGAGDVALDVEAVRRTLGYDRIDYYAFSYGTVAEQGYAARFPRRVHALVLDAGLVASDESQSYALGLDVPKALVRIETLLCRRDPTCHGDMPDAIGALVASVRAHQILSGGQVAVDEPALINLLRSGGNQAMMAPPSEILAAASALAHGNTTPLVDLAAGHSLWPGPQGVASDFSAGDNIAASCSDLPTVWRRSDPIAARQQSYDAALAAFPAQTFAPFSVTGWSVYNASEECLLWPAPRRYVPAVPTTAPLQNLPALIFSGDVDSSVPTEMARRLLTEFPHAVLVAVAGAGHPAIAWRQDCVPRIAAHFFATLRPGDTSCAMRPS